MCVCMCVYVCVRVCVCVRILLTCYDLLIILLSQFPGDTALNRAMSGGHTEVVQYLLSQGAKVNTCYIHTYIRHYVTGLQKSTM